MAGDVALKLVLQKLSSFESKVEGALEKFNSLESSLQGIEGEIATLTAKTSVVNDDKSVGEMDNSLKFFVQNHKWFHYQWSFSIQIKAR